MSLMAAAIRGTFLESGTEISCQPDPHNEIKFFDAVLPQQTGIFSRSSRIIAVSKTQIAEISPHPFSIQKIGIVLEVHELRGLDRLKFKKGGAGILTLQFKNDKIMRFAMTTPDACVDCIKERMKTIGLAGESKASPIDMKKITTAEAFLEATSEIEAQFILRPSFQLVMQMMDLLREAVEQFAEAGDTRYAEVTQTIQNFLRREDVMRIIDDNENEEKLAIAEKEEKKKEQERQKGSKASSKSRSEIELVSTTVSSSPSPLRASRDSTIEGHHGYLSSPHSIDSEESGWICEHREQRDDDGEDEDIYNYFPRTDDVVETTGLREMGLSNPSVLSTAASATPPSSATKSAFSSRVADTTSSPSAAAAVVTEEEVEEETANFHVNLLAQDQGEFSDTNPMMKVRMSTGSSSESGKKSRKETSASSPSSSSSSVKSSSVAVVPAARTPTASSSPASAAAAAANSLPAAAAAAAAAIDTSSVVLSSPSPTPSPAVNSSSYTEDISALGDEFAFLLDTTSSASNSTKATTAAAMAATCTTTVSTGTSSIDALPVEVDRSNNGSDFIITDTSVIAAAETEAAAAAPSSSSSSYFLSSSLLSKSSSSSSAQPPPIPQLIDGNDSGDDNEDFAIFSSGSAASSRGNGTEATGAAAGDVVDELSSMLGDITQEFHSMITTLSKVDDNDDDDDDIFGERAAAAISSATTLGSSSATEQSS